MRRRNRIDTGKGKRSKYGAVRTEVDGIKFASKKEAKRYGELKLLAKAGEIRNLRCQPWFVLMAPRIEGGIANINEGRIVGRLTVGQYRADFDYERLVKEKSYGSAVWAYVVEDVKSPATRTDMFLWKKRHMKAQYDIDVVEV